MPGSFAYQRTVVGYHGCDRSVAEQVLLDGGALTPSDNDYDWLGKGVYFWEHGPKRAREFAEWKHARGEIGEPFVLGAYIQLGRCFDLTDTAATGSLGAWYDLLAQELASKGRSLPENRAAGREDFDLVLRRLDCAVLNFALSELESLGLGHDTVRGVFTEGAPAYPGARICSKTHVQIAVRNSDCIVGYFRPAAGDGTG
jgi:hypothetical protein